MQANNTATTQEVLSELEGIDATLFRQVKRQEATISHMLLLEAPFLLLLTKSGTVFVINWQDSKVVTEHMLKSFVPESRVIQMVMQTPTDVIIQTEQRVIYVDLKGPSDRILIERESISQMHAFKKEIAILSSNGEQITVLDIETMKEEVIDIPAPAIQLMCGCNEANKLYLRATSELRSFNMSTRTYRVVADFTPLQQAVSLYNSRSCPHLVISVNHISVKIIDTRNEVMVEEFDIAFAICNKLCALDFVDENRFIVITNDFKGLFVYIGRLDDEQMFESFEFVFAKIPDSVATLQYDHKSRVWLAGYEQNLALAKLDGGRLNWTMIEHELLKKQEYFKQLIEVRGKPFLVFTCTPSNTAVIEDLSGSYRRVIKFPEVVWLNYIDEKEIVVRSANQRLIIFYGYNWDKDEPLAIKGKFSLNAMDEELIQYLSWTQNGFRLVACRSILNFFRSDSIQVRRFNLRGKKLSKFFLDGRLLVCESIFKDLRVITLAQNRKKLIHRFHFQPYGDFLDRLDKYPNYSQRRVNFFAYNNPLGRKIKETNYLGVVFQLKELAKSRKNERQTLETEVSFAGKLSKYAFSSNITKFYFYRKEGNRQFLKYLSDDNIFIMAYFTIASHFEPLYTYTDEEGFYWMVVSERKDVANLYILRIRIRGVRCE